MKFGIVGVIAFVIDWGILNLLVGVFHMHNVLAATISFIISLIFNYLASMKFVFKHRDDMARWMEIVIFVAGGGGGVVPLPPEKKGLPPAAPLGGVQGCREGGGIRRFKGAVRGGRDTGARLWGPRPP